MLQEQAKQLFLAAVVIDLTNELVDAAPFLTGTLRNSIQFIKQPDGSYKISMVDYALYVEFGTAPHVITPKNARALRFQQGSGAVFSMRVEHPGTQPNPFIRRTIKSSLPRIVNKNIRRYLVE